MHGITQVKGPFTLFALFRRDPLGPWDLVVSAPWLEHGKLKAVGELLRLLSDRIGEETVKEFGRIATVARDDEFVEFLLTNLLSTTANFASQAPIFDD